jgi:hypothetical protein
VNAAPSSWHAVAPSDVVNANAASRVFTFPVGPDVIVTTGAVVSFTVTVKDFGVAGLPAASVAVHVTVVVPSGNCEPDEGVHAGITETLVAPEPSVAVAAYETETDVPLAIDWVMFAGTVIVGGVLSSIVTVKLAGAAAFPAMSFPLQVTVVGP